MRTRHTAAAAIGAAALAATLAATTGTANAAPPTLSMSAPHVAVTLPSGCVANSVNLVAAADGSEHGYIQATCSKKAKLFYVARSSGLKWSLRSTKIDMPIVYSTTTDNTGTYFVGKRSNHDLVLVRRNGNGSLSKVHVLDKVDPIGFAHVERASVVASNGNYWAVWDVNSYSTDFASHDVYQARSIKPAIKASPVSDNLWYAPTLVKAGSNFTLVACELSSEQTQDDPVSSTVVAVRSAGKWKRSQQFTADDCAKTASTGSAGAAEFLNGHTYFSRSGTGGVYDNHAGPFRRTALSGSHTPRSVMNAGNGWVNYVATSAAGRELVWQSHDDGTFDATATWTMPTSPIAVYRDQVIGAPGNITRVFIQKSSTGKPGSRLLEQVATFL